MAVPTTFPIWMTKPGSLDALVSDLPSYTVMVGQGYAYATSVPTVTTMVGSVSDIITETPINPAQSDPVASDQDNLP